MKAGSFVKTSLLFPKGCITIVLLLLIVMIGMEWEAKAQFGLLIILLLAIVDFVIGSFMGPKNEVERAKGFIGYNGQSFSSLRGFLPRSLKECNFRNSIIIIIIIIFSIIDSRSSRGELPSGLQIQRGCGAQFFFSTRYILSSGNRYSGRCEYIRGLKGDLVLSTVTRRRRDIN